MNGRWCIFLAATCLSATVGVALKPIETTLRHKAEDAKLALGAVERGSREALIEAELYGRQPVPGRSTVTTRSHQSFFSRLSDSLVEFVVGLVLIVFSFPVLWFNEGRNAKVESLLERGFSQCRTVSGKTVDEENRNWLVHLQGEPMTATERVSDAQFNVAFDRNCVRLRSVVEVYQYIEHEKREEREKFGGGKETITTYTYEAKWDATWHDSASYQDRSIVNRRPARLDLGTHITDCARVQCGEAFILSAGLVQQCDNFTPAESLLNSTVQARSVAFTKRADGTFYHCLDGNSGLDGPPEIGDARVTFSYVPDGPVSLLALQVDTPNRSQDSFLPYRLVRRPLFSAMSEKEEKAALRQRAELSTEELGQESQIGDGCLWCLCCACNIVMKICAEAFTPQIYRLYIGSKTLDECFRCVKSEMKLLVWLLRLAGWLMLYIGLVMLFSPFLTFIKIIPFLGPILSNLGSFLVWVLSGLVTLAVASLIVCLAYMAYRPFWSLVYSLCAAGVILIPLAVIHFAH